MALLSFLTFTGTSKSLSLTHGLERGQAPFAVMSSRSNGTGSHPSVPPPGSGSGTPNSSPMDIVVVSPGSRPPDAQALVGQMTSFRIPKGLKNQAQAELGMELGRSLSESLRNLGKSFVETVRLGQSVDGIQTMIERRSTEREKWRKFDSAPYEAMAGFDAKKVKMLQTTREEQRRKVTDQEEYQARQIEDFVKSLISVVVPEHNRIRENPETDQLRDEMRILKAEMKILRSDSMGDYQRIVALENQSIKKEEADQIKTNMGQTRALQSNLGRLENQIKDMKSSRLDAFTYTKSDIRQLIDTQVEKKTGTTSSIAISLDEVTKELRVLQSSNESRSAMLQLLKEDVRELKDDASPKPPSIDNSAWERLDDVEKKAQSTHDILIDHRKDQINYETRLLELESRETSRAQKIFVDKAEFEALQSRAESIEIDQTKCSNSLSELLSQIQSYAVNHATQLEKMQESLQSTRCQLQRDFEGLREGFRALQQDHLKILNNRPLNEKEVLDQSNVAVQQPNNQGWRFSPSEQSATGEHKEIALLQQRTQSLETFVQSHEQRLNNTTLEPFLRAIVNQMKVMYPYPDAVVRDLHTLSAHYAQLKQAHQVTAQEFPSLRTRLGRLEAEVVKKIGQPVGLDEKTANDITQLRAGLTRLESSFHEYQEEQKTNQNHMLEQRLTDHASRDDNDRVSDIEKQLEVLRKDSNTRLEESAAHIAREASIRTQYHSDHQNVLEVAKEKYDRQIAALESRSKKDIEELRDALVDEVGDYQCKMLVLDEAVKRLREEFDDSKVNTMKTIFPKKTSPDLAGNGSSGLAMPRSPNSPARTNTSTGSKNSSSDKRADPPNYGQNVLGRRKKRKRRTVYSDDDDDSSYKP